MLQRPPGIVDTPDDIATLLKDRLRSKGEKATCAELLISRNTASKMAAGLPVRRGSIAVVRQRLAEIAAATPTAGEAA